MQTVIVIMLAVVGVGETPPGFFYAVHGPNLTDQLFRIEWDGTETAIGREGALGFPNVAGLVWDWEHNELYGFDTLLDVWLHINTESGVATSLGPFDISLTDMTYSPFDGMVYGIYQGSIYAINQFDGSYELALQASSNFKTIAVGTDLSGGISGFVTTSSGLYVINWPDFDVIYFGGSAPQRKHLFWHPSTLQLINFQFGGTNRMFDVNLVSGNETELLAEWNPTSLIYWVTFVPNQPPPAQACTVMDVDDDGDVDLLDYADWQNCFTGIGK